MSKPMKAVGAAGRDLARVRYSYALGMRKAGASVAEIARELGCGPSAVYPMLRKAQGYLEQDRKERESDGAHR
jgi:predicted transcriptional regulator